MKISCTNCGKTIREEPDIIRPSEEEIKRVEELLAQTCNDPNLVITTHSFNLDLDLYYEGMCVNCYDYVFHHWNLPEIKVIIQ